MKYFSMESLNKKALNKITMLHKMILNHSSELANGFDLPLCREKNGAELSSKDLEILFGTYNFWRISNGLCNLSYITKLFEVGNISTTEKSVSVETFTIRVGSMSLSVSDFEPCLDIPSEFAKRDGKSEKAKTAENKKVEAEKAEVVATAEKVVSENEELKNENKALKASADKFNAEVEKDNAEILQNCIKSYTEMICKLFGDDVDKEQKKAVAKMLSNFAVAISE